MLATQCLVQKRPKTMRINYAGELGSGVTAKDLILATIGRLGTGGMTGHAVEYAGPAIEALSMPGRMTVCNMTIEGGGRAGMIAPDETTFEWVRGRPGAPADFDAARRALARAADRPRRELRPGGRDRRRRNLADGHLGHQPRHGRRGHRPRPRPGRAGVAGRSRGGRTRPRLHGPGGRDPDDRGRSRTRLHRLLHQLADRGPARGGGGGRRAQGRRLGPGDGRPRLPAGQGSGRSRGPRRGLPQRRLRMARGGLLDVPGHEPRHPVEGERCASTSNRNFEGRQGKGGRTHLVSPRMAAAAAIEGHFVDIRDWS